MSRAERVVEKKKEIAFDQEGIKTSRHQRRGMKKRRKRTGQTLGARDNNRTMKRKREVQTGGQAQNESTSRINGHRKILRTGKCSVGEKANQSQK